jgi:putative flippase GtrA
MSGWTTRADIRRVVRFIAVGTTAAAVHWLVVVALVESGRLLPLIANVGGWLTALGVSFAGHHRLTFAGHGTGAGRSAKRFALLSATGFAINETAYAVLLRFSPQHYAVALGAVLIAVAFITYRLSRTWAFAEKAAG